MRFKKPKVSVCMITYNHEKFIRQAVESVVGQKVDFRIELVVGDDCSTDNTRGILLQLKKEYPNIIKLVDHNRNVGHMGNLISVFEKIKGGYVACLEGDDYWTDPCKLQKQADILDKKPDISMASHITTVAYESVDKKSHPFGGFVPQETICSTEEVITHLFSHFSSMMFRAKYIPMLPDWFRDCYSGDKALGLIISYFGNIYHIKEVMSIYRVHAGGMHSKKRKDNMELLMNYLSILSHFDLFSERKYHDQISRRILRYINKLLPGIHTDD